MCTLANSRKVATPPNSVSVVTTGMWVSLPRHRRFVSGRRGALWITPAQTFKIRGSALVGICTLSSGSLGWLLVF
ncbi:hypothetical protein BN11_1740005 [Nostocoides australiense Ben110]|uniref:Uncharacterized protein n=1 Tax=Nostocoides australiense Ben110 TaxID=1193182 RepID=W6JUD5_9MICO|nr:hypothetical protein BN11_1740005 [Tetrasphaera australiensis Ben110]